MKKIKFELLIFLLLIPLISADRAGVIVGFPDGSLYGQCLSADRDANGYDLLKKLSLETLFAGPSSFGHMLCKINTVGNEVNGNFCSFSSNKFWRFSIAKDNEWKSMPVGFDGGNGCWNSDLNSFDGHYCVKDKDVIVLDFAEWNENFPAFYSFEDICEPLKLKKVKVYADGKKQNDADEDGGEIKATPNSKISFSLELENKYLFDDIKIEDIEIEINIDDVNGKDIKKDIKIKDLDINEEIKKNIEIVLPNLKNDKYEVELKIIGKYLNMKQEIREDYSLEIEESNNDKLLFETELENRESCPNDPNNLVLNIDNLNNENELFSINIKSIELKLDFSETVQINSKSSYKKNFKFEVPKLNNGDYNIMVSLDYSENLKKELTLTITNCDDKIKSDTIKSVNQKNSNIQKLPVKNPYIEKKSFLESYLLIILLGVFLSFLIVSLVLIMIMINR